MLVAVGSATVHGLSLGKSSWDVEIEELVEAAV